MNIHVSTNAHSKNTSRLGLNAASMLQLIISNWSEFLSEIPRRKNEYLKRGVSVLIRSKIRFVFGPGCACCGSLTIFFSLFVPTRKGWEWGQKQKGERLARPPPLPHVCTIGTADTTYQINFTLTNIKQEHKIVI